MANFSQLRRQKSSREIVFRQQLSGDLDIAGDLEMGAPSGPTATGFRPRSATRVSLRRQMSEAPDPDEIGSIMWEMRPRRATTAGELRRRKKAKAERERKEVRRVTNVFNDNK